MSNDTRTSSSSSGVDLFNIIFIIMLSLIAVIMIPTVIFLACFLALGLWKNIRWFYFVGGGAAILLLNNYFLKANLFVTKILENFRFLVDNFLEMGLLKKLPIIFKTFSFFDYVYFMAFGAIICGFLLYKLGEKDKRFKAGVRDLDSSIEDVLAHKKDNKKAVIKTLKVKENLNKQIHPSNYTLLGVNALTHEPVAIKDDFIHVFIPGTTGAGKTTTIDNFLESAFQKNMDVLFIDGKGDLKEDSVKDHIVALSRKNRRKTYVINLVNPAMSDKYNPFANSDIQEIKDMLISMTDWSEEHYKLNTQRYLQRVLQLMEKADIPFSFKTIVECLNSNKFELLSADLVKSNSISKEEHLSNMELSKNSKDIIAGAVARFADIAEGAAGTILDESGVDISQAFKENAAIVFILNPLSMPELSNAFGKLVTIDSKKAVARAFTQNFKKKLFIFDELSVYVSHSLIDLVNKSRSAGVSCILGTQSLSDLSGYGGDDFKDVVIENCSNFIFMRTHVSGNSEEAAKIIGTEPVMEVTHQFGSNGESTGLGSTKKVRRFIIEPDIIKNLLPGEAVYHSKETGEALVMFVRKPEIPSVDEYPEINDVFIPRDEEVDISEL